MYHHTVAQIARHLKTKQYSSVEITQHYLNRIEKLDPQLNSFITVTAETALKQAQSADEAIAKNQATPLTGVPIAYKDIFCTLGIKTTCASKILHNYIAPYDATVIARLNQAGCVMLGKTNLDEFAMGSSNESSYFGAVKNPWNLEWVPGGSSGGSAAAVAGLLAPIALGTDTGGSVRQPAAFCQLTGLKPTYGRVSRYGMIAYASSLDQAGIFAHSAEDTALLLQAMAGLDADDSTSADVEVPNYQQHLNDSIKGKRIGLPKQYFGEGLDPTIAEAVHVAAKQLEKLGATIHEIDLPNSPYAIPAYYVVALAECSSNLARFDGVRYGYRCDDPKDLTDLYERTRAEGFGEEVKRRILLGTYVLSAGYYDAYYLKGQKLRYLIREDFQKAFEQVDVILGPTTPTTPFKIGEKVNDPISLYLSDIYTVAINLAGLPALSLPVGLSNGKPIGAQLIAPYFQEAFLLNVAHQYQQQTEWHTQIAPFATQI